MERVPAKRQDMADDLNISPTPLSGVFVIDPVRHADERGFFARTFCRQEFEAHGLQTAIAQCNTSFNPRRGTLRGMHLQLPPHAEVKLVRCIRGALFDAVVDLRAGSPTLGQWFATELNEENRRMLYIPEGIAHGFLTLEDNTELYYQISAFYHPECARGVRWNDPLIGMPWPFPPVLISSRDAAFPLLQPGYQLAAESEQS